MAVNIPGSLGTTPGQYAVTTGPNTGATNTNPLVGSTSGGATWIPDILTICQEAAEMAGYDMTEGYSLRSFKRSLDFLTMEWANKGLNLWTIDEQTQVLTAGTPSYVLPADTIDVVYPVIRTTVGGVQQDIPIGREDFTDYAAIPNKTQQGRPVVCYVQRQVAQPQIWLWLVPDNVTTYTLVFWRLRRMQTTGYATNTLDLPFRFIPAITAGLAWRQSLKRKIKDWNLSDRLKVIYEQNLIEAQGQDQERASIFLRPRCY